MSDGWEPLPFHPGQGHARSMRVILLRRRSEVLCKKAHDLWMLFSVCSGFGGFVSEAANTEYLEAVREWETARLLYEQALAEEK